MKFKSKRERTICDEIIKLTNIQQGDVTSPAEGYKNVEMLREKLYAQLRQICKNNDERLFNNIVYIKDHIKYPKDWGVEVGVIGKMPYVRGKISRHKSNL